MIDMAKILKRQKHIASLVQQQSIMLMSEPKELRSESKILLEFYNIRIKRYGETFSQFCLIKQVIDDHVNMLWNW